MEVLVPGVEPIQADIVFVHGLRGDRIKTWDVDGVVWPRDLLPKELPNARIMSYGYDEKPQSWEQQLLTSLAQIKANVMNFFSNASQSSIFQHAVNLLEDLQRKRRSTDEKARPIIFVGHSLGGLVIKDALCKSHEYKSSERNSRAAAVIDSTYGIAFLGTPHRGGNHTAWAKIATNFANAVLKDHNARVIDALKTGSEILERLQDSFCGIVKQISIFSFLEDIAFGSAGKIVDDDSATLGLACERKQWIPANHSDMCKFKSETDHGYERVSGGIIDLVEDAVEAVGKKEAEKDAWVNVDQNGQPIDMTSDMMRVAYGPFNKALKNPDEWFDKSDWGIKAKARNDALDLPNEEKIRNISFLFFRRFFPITEGRASQALLTACMRNGRLATAKYLLEIGADDKAKMSGKPVLLLAMQQGGMPAVKLLLDFGANPNVTDRLGVTPLMCAASSGAQNYTAMLIEAKADLNQQDSSGATALMHAVLAASYEVVSLLLAAGADQTIRSDRRLTALDMAARLGPRRGDDICQLLKAPPPQTSLDKSQLPNATNPKDGEKGIIPGVGDQGVPSQLPLGSTPGELRSESAQKLPFR